MINTPLRFVLVFALSLVLGIAVATWIRYYDRVREVPTSRASVINYAQGTEVSGTIRSVNTEKKSLTVSLLPLHNSEAQRSLELTYTDTTMFFRQISLKREGVAYALRREQAAADVLVPGINFYGVYFINERGIFELRVGAVGDVY